jgi:hypothetical protein
MRRRLILPPLVLLLLASCSSSSKPTSAVAAAPVATVPTTAAAASTSTAAATTSTVAAATVPPSTTSTTAAKSLELVVAEAAAQNWIVDRENCFLTIDTCDPTSFTPDGSVQRERVTKLVTDYRVANFKVRINADDPTYLVVKRVELSADRTTAEVKACYWSTDIVFEPNEKATSGEIISDDTKSSYDMVFKMVLVGKRWLVTENESLTEYQGFNTCPAK